MTRSHLVRMGVAAAICAVSVTAAARPIRGVEARSYSVREVLTDTNLHQVVPIIVHGMVFYGVEGMGLVDDRCPERFECNVGLNIPRDIEKRTDVRLLLDHWSNGEHKYYAKLKVLVVYKHRARRIGSPPTPLSVSQFQLVEVIGAGPRRFR